MIYWRQKVLLMLLGKAPSKKASKSRFVKWLFLLKEEEKIDRYGIFYDFLPYKYGPFSFLAYREINELERFGWIKSDEHFFQYTCSEPDTVENALPPVVVDSIASIMANYRELPSNDLLKYIYEKYPWYVSGNGFRGSTHFVDTLDIQKGIYSLGYEGLSIDAFLNVILRARIRTIVDIRNNPVSRKYGFAKSTLEKRCKDIGLKYYHFPEVGIPSKIRNQIQDKHTLWNLYIQKILPQTSTTLKSLAEICTKEPAVFICFEKNPEDCHRHVLSKKLSVKTGLPVIHYNKGGEVWEKE